MTIQNPHQTYFIQNNTKAFKLYKTIEKQAESNEEFQKILTEIRHMVYKEFVDHEELMQEAKTFLNDDSDIKIENENRYYKTLRQIRSELALVFISNLRERERELLLGDIKVRHFDMNPDNFFVENNKDGYFSKEQGRLVRPIMPYTSTYDLLNILYAIEQNGYKSDKNFQSIWRSAAETLTRKLITEQPSLIEKAVMFLNADDFRKILVNRTDNALSDGKIGGKSIGIILAYSALRQDTPEFDEKFCTKSYRGSVEDLHKKINIKDTLQENNSLFISSGVFSEFVTHNKDLSVVTQLKGFYDSNSLTKDDNMKREHLHNIIDKAFDKSDFPAHIKRQLKKLFKKLHNEHKPIIVRSSSELEDAKDTAFAGKYDSIELSMSGNFNEDYEKFLEAIKTVYKSAFSPDVMSYRKNMNCLYDYESMGILIQDLNGEKYNNFFYPHFSVVAMSHATQSYDSDSERGAFSIATGLGQEVVENGGRFVMFAKPKSTGVIDFRQNEVVVMDLNDNKKKVLSSKEFIQNRDTKVLSYACDNYNMFGDNKYVSITNEYIVTMTDLPLILEYIVQKLKYLLGYDVDCEFTVQRSNNGLKINLVQCRPQNIPKNLAPSKIPNHIPDEQKIVESKDSYTSGVAKNIRYLVYISPEIFSDTEAMSYSGAGNMIKKYVSEINKKLNSNDKKYFIINPRRWGSQDFGPHGIPARFSDFSHATGFIEVFDLDFSPSFGTHFFQDVMDSEMVSGSIKEGNLNFDFIKKSENSIDDILQEQIPPNIKKYIKLIDVEKSFKNLSGKDKEWRMHIALNNTSKDGGPSTSLYIAEKDKDTPLLLS